MNIFSVPDGGVFFVFTIQEICPSRCLLLQKWSKFCKSGHFSDWGLVTRDWQLGIRDWGLGIAAWDSGIPVS